MVSCCGVNHIAVVFYLLRQSENRIKFWQSMLHSVEFYVSKLCVQMQTNIRILNIIRIVNLIFEYSFVLINMFIGLNRATILVFAA